MTHTRTHVFVTWFNPYHLCDLCGRWVTGWHDIARCGCADGFNAVMPCGHDANAVDVCPSWGPVDGCRCVEQLGRVDHAVPPDYDGAVR